MSLRAMAPTKPRHGARPISVCFAAFAWVQFGSSICPALGSKLPRHPSALEPLVERAKLLAKGRVAEIDATILSNMSLGGMRSVLSLAESCVGSLGPSAVVPDVILGEAIYVVGSACHCHIAAPMDLQRAMDIIDDIRGARIAGVMVVKFELQALRVIAGNARASAEVEKRVVDRVEALKHAARTIYITAWWALEVLTCVGQHLATDASTLRRLGKLMQEVAEVHGKHGNALTVLLRRVLGDASLDDGGSMRAELAGHVIMRMPLSNRFTLGSHCVDFLRIIVATPSMLSLVAPAMSQRGLPSDVIALLGEYLNGVTLQAVARCGDTPGTLPQKEAQALGSALFAAVCAPIEAVGAEAATLFAEMAEREGIVLELDDASLAAVGRCLAASAHAGMRSKLVVKASEVLRGVAKLRIRGAGERRAICAGLQNLCGVLAKLTEPVTDAHTEGSELCVARLAAACGGVSNGGL